jgi:hypothetical protein
MPEPGSVDLSLGVEFFGCVKLLTLVNVLPIKNR